MIVSGSSLTDYGLIGTIGNYATALNGRETLLTAQATSGLVATGVTGLGADTSKILNLQPQLAQLTAFAGNATMAGSRLDTAQAALSSISTLASTLQATLTQVTTSSGSGLQTALESAAAQAGAQLGTLTSLLNTKSGDGYVFAGSDATEAPVPDPTGVASGALSSGAAAAIGGLEANGAAATLQSVIAGANANSIFAPGLSGGAQGQTVAIGFGQQAVVGLPATSTVGMSGANATSTGSGLGDLVAVLSAVAGLSPSDAGSSQFSTFISGLQTALSGAQTGIGAMTSTLAVSQQQVTSETTVNGLISDALTSQIGDLTSVDLPTVSTQLSETQNQLMASYEIINDLKGMTLADYL
jgi:flagellar hook-associated protein 3 FlgL